MALPKFTELSTAAQIGVIVGVGALLWGASEYVLLKPVSDQNAQKQQTAIALETDNAKYRPDRDRLRQLITDNQQLEIQLRNLQQIVPNEKEVDNFVRQVQGEASLEGVFVRRFTAKNLVQQEFYIELPFEVELDGSYFDVQRFYDRLGRLPRIINVSTLKIGSIEAGKTVGNKRYNYSPAETIVAVCTVTTFFSREEDLAAVTPATPAGRPPAGAPRR